jgi:TonB family protein
MTNKSLYLSGFSSIIIHIFLIISFSETKLSSKTNFSENLGSRQIKATLTLYERRPEKKKILPKTNSLKPTKTNTQSVLQRTTTKPSLGARGSKDSGSKALMAKFLSQVRAQIAQSKFKTKMARRLKLKGKVKLNFILKKPNIIDKISIIESSNIKQIDQSALQTIDSVKDLPSIPLKLNRVEIPITLVISYE